MKRKKFYVVPETEVIAVCGEQLLQDTSTQHTPGVQDEVVDDGEDDDAPFNFAKGHNWFEED